MDAKHSDRGSSNEYPDAGYAPETLAMDPAGSSLWSPTLPPELWLSVFPHVEDADLRSITLTCLDFRILAQPLLFRVLDVSPFFLAYNADRPIFRPRRYLQRTLERLEFYKSSRIAPGVTHLWVSPYSRRGFPTRRLTDDLNPTLIVSAVIDSLSSFPSIRELSWHCFDIQSQWWLELRRLPLTRIWINSCSIVPPTSRTSLHSLFPFPRIATVDFDQWAWEGEITNHVSIHEERLYGVDTDVLSLTINPECIRSISVPRNDTALRLLGILKSLNANIPCLLLNLTIPYSCIQFDDFVPALMRLDKLNELHILPPSDIQNIGSMNDNELLMAPLPNLEVYEGPYHLLSSFVNRNRPRYRVSHRLRSLVLWGLDERPESTVCDPHLLVQVLKDLEQRDDALEALKAVHLSLTHITLELAVFLEQFKHLEEIFIETQDSLMPDRTIPLSVFELAPESPITVLYVILRSQQFSSSLSHLTLITHLKNTSNLNHATQRLEAAKFLEELGRVNPRLDKIDLKYGTYWTGVVDITWRRRLLSNSSLNEADENILTSHSGRFSRSSSGCSTPTTQSRTNPESSITHAPEVTTATAMDPSSRNSNERFVQLPSRPKITTTIDVGIGQILFTEQRRSIMLPEKVLPLNETIGDVNSDHGWVFHSVRRILRFVGSVGVVIKEGVGLMRG